MKNLIKFLFVSLIIIVFGCSSDQQPQISCFTPPGSFSFEIVDKNTGENLFTNRTYLPNQIEIIDLANNTQIPHTFISENGINLINIHTIGWKTEKVNYSITIQGKKIFGFYVDASRISGKCSYTRYNEITIQNSEFEVNKNNGSYKILVPSI